MPLRQGPLLPTLGFVWLEPEGLILSALKRSESGDRLVLRCYNASVSRATGYFRFGFGLASAWQATAAEQANRSLELDTDGAGCHLDIGPCEIVTLLLDPARP